MSEQGPEQPIGAANDTYDDNKLNEDLDKLEKKKKEDEKKYRHEIDGQDDEINQITHEMRLLQLKYREKVQEFRLSELKIKELKR